MAGSYRPRPVQIKQCVQCNTRFESRHKRTVYCSASCRTLAYNQRQQEIDPLLPVEPVTTELAVSSQNILVTALGTGAVALANATLNDWPAQDKIIKKLEGLANQVQDLKAHLVAHDDFIDGMKQLDSGLSWAIATASQKRQLSTPKKVESVSEKAQRMLAERKSKMGH